MQSQHQANVDDASDLAILYYNIELQPWPYVKHQICETSDLHTRCRTSDACSFYISFHPTNSAKALTDSMHSCKL